MVMRMVLFAALAAGAQAARPLLGGTGAPMSACAAYSASLDALLDAPPPATEAARAAQRALRDALAAECAPPKAPWPRPGFFDDSVWAIDMSRAEATWVRALFKDVY